MTYWFQADHRTQNERSHDRSIAWCLGGLLFVVYLLTYTGYIQSSDGLAMFATAESMARRGEIDSNQLLWMGTQQGNIGPDGDLYSRKGLGMTLLALPFIWIALIWPSIGLVQAALLLNPILTAWTGSLVYLTGRRLRWPRGPAAVTALAFGLGTLAWPYTQTFFSDPVCMWGLFGAAYGLLAHAQTGRKRYLFAAGLLWSLAYLARVINLATLPIFTVGLVAAILAATPSPHRAWRSIANSLWRDSWRPLISFIIPVFIAGLVSLYWNWARFGSIWDSGYVETERFDAIWWFGITGLIAGPARGLFWYSPILLLVLWGGLILWRQARAVALFSIAITVLYILIYGKWYMWHGGYSWGPRFIVPTIPYLILLAGPVIVRAMAARSRLPMLALSLLLLLSAGVQLLGMAVPFGLVQDWLDAEVQPLFAPETFTRLEYSPLLLQWQFLQPHNIHFLWWPGAKNGGPVRWLMPGLLLLLVILGALLLHRLLHIKRSAHAEEAHSRYRLWAAGARPYIVAVVLASFLLLTMAYATQSHPDIRAVAQRITEMEAPDDAILHLRSAETQAFANAYHGRLPVYGQIGGGGLGEAQLLWQTALRNRHNRIWLVPDVAVAEQSGWERELRAHDFLLYEYRGGNDTRTVLFASSQAYSLPETGLGTIFGDPANEAEPITADNGWIRLSGYAITPETRPGEELLVALRWECLQGVNYDYHVFVHILNQAGERVAQRDGQPVQWLRPTSTWQSGEEITDRYGLILPDDLLPGEYTVAVGLYDPVSGRRLPVSAGPAGYAIELGPIVVRS